MSNCLKQAAQSVKIKVAEHPDAHVNKTHGYISVVVDALTGLGLDLTAAWLDPSDPRDATITYRIDGQQRALVWDEETGWRDGEYVSGRQGVRTTLYDVTYIGGGVLPAPAVLARLISDGIGSSEPVIFRSYTDQDALNEQLLAYEA